MSERFDEVPRVKLRIIPYHLRKLAATAQNLTERSFEGRELGISPKHIEHTGGMFRSYWEYYLDTPGDFERFSVHLASDALMITHEHRHTNALSHLPYIGAPAPKEFERITAVIEQGKATLFQSNGGGIGPSIEIARQPELRSHFSSRVYHALSTIGINEYAELLDKTG